MVNGPSPTSGPQESSPSGVAPQKPFALRATIYTIGFLVVVLGVIPSIFHILGKMPVRDLPIGTEIRLFWTGFRHLVGIGLFAGGLFTYVACSAWLIYCGRGPHVEFDPPKVFVATGPYRWVRNPVVITLMICVLGEAIYFGSLGMFVLIAVGCCFAQYQVTKIEEPRLRERFGETYVEYCNRVHRWIPRPPADES
ncbi:MAG: hypothetical protein DCC65_06515 [Planctomycetota bacterium]|nr:MAG: hypothetical protein DCC65_06515 [Planctomycetota bacterium]